MTAGSRCITPRLVGPPLTVGLVNNMAASAAAAAERQFRGLLGAAFPERPIHLRRLTCVSAQWPAPASGPERYDALADGSAIPDVLIVTGAEPVARCLADEPIWAGIAWLADWAGDHGVPVIWSCLAGHAAVRALDGIERIRLPAKLSGVFVSKLAGQGDRVTADLPARIAMPQSRYHGLPDRMLEERGYRVLARSPETGADVFAKQAGAPFLFLQGHPEYEAETLMREYRRDVRRALEGVRNGWPALPRSYFSASAEEALLALSARAAEARSAVGLAEFNAILNDAGLQAAWQAPAARLVANWLTGAARTVHSRADAVPAHRSHTRRSAVA